MRKLKFLLALSSLTLPLCGQVPNKSVQLDGDGDYVELPSNIFNALDDATVEGWVRWDSFGVYTRFFDFGKAWETMVVGNFQATPNLSFELWTPGRQQQAIIVPNILQTNQWCHIALVTGKKGIQFYFNGMQVGTNEFTGSFSAIKNNDRNFLGRNNWKEESPLSEDFKGSLDEVRVWKTGRTGDEIRKTMFQKLRGDEPGLFAQWTFDDGSAKDSGPSGHHGKFQGDAKAMDSKLPGDQELLKPTLVLGTLKDEHGTPLPRGRVTLEIKGIPVVSGNADNRGNYSLAVYPTNELYDLSGNQGKAIGTKKGIKLEPGREHRVNLTLAQQFSLSGKVIASDTKKPMSALVIQALRVQTNSPATAAPNNRKEQSEAAATTLTETNGSFKFPDLRDGRYTLRSHLPGKFFPLGEGKELVVAKEKPLTNLVFEVPAFKTGQWQRVTMESGPKLAGITQMKADGSVLWIGTTAGGFRIEGNQSRFFGTNEGLADHEVTTLAAGKGEMWVGTRKGLSRFEEKKGLWTTFTTRDGLADNKITALWHDGKSNLWIGSDFGLKVFNGQKITSPVIQGEFSPRNISALSGSGTTVWIGTFGYGAFRLDGSSLTHFSKTNGLGDDRIRALSVQGDGSAWIAAGNNLHRVSGTNISTVTQRDGLGAGMIKVLDQSGDDGLWIGTSGGAAQHQGNTFIHYSTGDSLPELAVVALSRTADGRVWLAGSNSLSSLMTKPRQAPVPPSALALKQTPKSSGVGAAAKSQSSGGNPLQLWGKRKVGARDIYRTDVVQRMEFSFPGMPKPQRQDFEMAHILALTPLKELEGGGYEMELEFLGQELVVRDGERVFIDFDSKLDAVSDPKDPLVPILRKLLGSKFRYQVAEDGRVEKIIDFNQFTERLLASGGEEGKGIFSQIFGESYFKSLLGFQAEYLRPSATAGQSWKQSTDVSLWLFGNFKADADITFKAMEERESRPCLAVQFSGPLSSKSSGGIMGNMDVDESRTIGKIWFDPALGAIIESEVENMLYARMSRGGPMDASNEIWQKVSIKFVERGMGQSPAGKN